MEWYDYGLKRINRIALAVLIDCLLNDGLFVDRLYISFLSIPARNIISVTHFFLKITSVKVLA